MKTFLLSAIKLREKLLKAKKGHVNELWAKHFMGNLKFWISNGADCNSLSQKWDNEIQIILVPTWINKYEQLKSRNKNVQTRAKSTLCP